MSAFSVSTSMILPFPSSPHWAPTKIVLAISLDEHRRSRALRAKLDVYRGRTLPNASSLMAISALTSDKDRWTEWDVWAHKYNLIGLLTYMQYTGNLANRCRFAERMADLLCNTFGDTPGKSVTSYRPASANHVGMALHQCFRAYGAALSNDGRKALPGFLQIHPALLGAGPNGPRIISRLLKLITRGQPGRRCQSL
jgi:hypothetical protein